MLLAVVPMYFGAHGLGEWGAGLSTGALMLASVAAEMVIPSVAAKVGYRRLLVVGLLLLGVPALALPAAPTLTGLLVVSVLRGVRFAVVVVCVGANPGAAWGVSPFSWVRGLQVATWSARRPCSARRMSLVG
jgi:hypothetical protein